MTEGTQHTTPINVEESPEHPSTPTFGNPRSRLTTEGATAAPPTAAESTEAPSFAIRSQPDQTQLLLENLNRLLGNAVRPPTPTSAGQIVRSEDLYRAVNWANMPQFSTADPGLIDRWFTQFEGRLSGNAVAEHAWLQRWHQCQLVDAKYKEMAIQHAAEIRDYPTLRRYFLDTYGPPFPTDFYKSRMYGLRDSTPVEAKDELDALLTVHNRAARDEGLSPMKPANLVYCYIGALPGALQDRLMEKLPDALDKECPYKYLCSVAATMARKRTTAYLAVAPEEESGAEDGNTLLVRGKSKKQRQFQESLRRQSRPQPPPTRPSQCDLERAMVSLAESVGRLTGGRRNRFTPQAPMPTGPTCPTCGRSGCGGGTTCPAFGKICNGCGRKGHFRTVCRSVPNANHTPMKPGFPRGQ